jgi:sarcosine/dimethylglycine N-methyltransferase
VTQHETERVTQEYYNSRDADQFYFNIWGGEDIHIGLYQSENEPIRQASERTVATMANMDGDLNATSRVVDLGAGYGGAARYLVRKHGCFVTCVNLSEVQNERNREMNEQAGMADRIEVIDGSFDSVPREDASYDLAWSEDAILHAPDREAVLKEAFRLLHPGGDFIFTDPMQKADAPPEKLQPVYDRIHLDSLASFEYYQRTAEKIGFETVEIRDLSDMLPLHYDRVRRELQSRYDEVCKLGSKDYVDRMLTGLGHWVDFGRQGLLSWGILHFRKPAEA